MFLPVTVVLDGVDMCKIKPPKISKIHVLGFSLTNLSLKDGLKVCNYFNYDKFIWQDCQFLNAFVPSVYLI